jgi:hypothetical protein
LGLLDIIHQQINGNPARSQDINLLGSRQKGFLSLVEHGEKPKDNHRHDRHRKKDLNQRKSALITTPRDTSGQVCGVRLRIRLKPKA